MFEMGGGDWGGFDVREVEFFEDVSGDNRREEFLVEVHLVSSDCY